MKRVFVTILTLMLTCQFSLAGVGMGNVLCLSGEGHVAVEGRHGVCDDDSADSRKAALQSSDDMTQPECETQTVWGHVMQAADCTDVDLSITTQRPLLRDHVDHDAIVQLPLDHWPELSDVSLTAGAQPASTCWRTHASAAAPAARQASHRQAILSTVMRL